MITDDVQQAGSLAQLRLWQLLSPALPIGAFAYSEGLETAVERGLVFDESTAGAWLGGLLEHAIAGIDLPVLVHMYDAASAEDHLRLTALDADLASRRESAELRASDAHLGTALVRLLDDLQVANASRWRGRPVSFALAMALASAAWGIDRRSALRAYAWTWLENQVAAAIKLVPLGQTAGQRLLMQLAGRIDDSVGAALRRAGADDIGACTPGLAIASALHETQYSRLFRS